ncbi:glycerol kinase [Lepeophtheirus salmonis]|uniref:glycerol kinase n=1 Tax=Lepeophtheirus salmonis TaxID=72036 RepID=UPI001AE92DF6|nr:glycerol kinase-like [Lepeophtheirus salmonis]
MKRSSSTDSTRNLGPLIGAIDQGTSSSRFMVFSAHTAELVTYHQIPVLPDSDCTHKGWIQCDPMRLLSTVEECIERTIDNMEKLDLDPWDIVAIGITNQRESVILWDKNTGKPFYPAILWCDARTEDTTLKKLMSETPYWRHEYVRYNSGLPIHSYFSAIKVKWLMENVPEVRDAIKEKRVLFGTVDTWLLWNLAERIHVTDVTNASRTSLMNIETLEWDENLCSFFGIPMTILPEIRSCSEIYGPLSRGRLAGVPISGCIGDQQAALVGQKCLRPGEMKATYGTGCFILKNIGPKILHSRRGLLTTVAYKAGPDSLPVYALEGSISFAGGAVDWLRDCLGINLYELDNVEDSGDVYFVPAFSGLFSPHWRPDARGIIMGLNRFSSKEHIFRATLEAAAYQTRDILEAMYEEFNETDSPSSLLVDGGLTENGSAMQILSDILGIPVLKPSMSETTALGAAIMAGRAEGIEVWDTRLESPSTKITVDHFLPHMSREERHRRYEKWKNAVERSLSWTSLTPKMDMESRLFSSIPCTIFLMTGLILLIVSEKMKQSP